MKLNDVVDGGSSVVLGIAWFAVTMFDLFASRFYIVGRMNLDSDQFNSIIRIANSQMGFQ